MRAKEFLSQAYLLDQRIKCKSEQVRRLNELATNCSATLTGMPGNPNRGGSAMADAVCEIIDLENEISRDMTRLVETQKRIKEVIGKVGDVELRIILEQRYLCGSAWEKIAMSLCHNRRWVFRLHDKALSEAQKILDDFETSHQKPL
jgi:hypothetical protein